MRVMQLIPGTGSFFCGSCLRDHSLARALIGRGHDVEIVPLYLPLVLEEGRNDAEIQLGGINMYLQQKSRLARRLPRWLTRLFDRPGLLRWASKRGNMTDAADLGEMTLSMVRGEDGNQRREVDKLVDWAKEQERPDVVLLSNVMLLGVARRLREGLGRPIIVTMQGEAPFLDALPDKQRAASWDELRRRAQDVDAFVGVSQYYSDLMRERLQLPADRVHTVYNGVDLSRLDLDAPPVVSRTPPAIGYLARMCRDKGLQTLVPAFAELKRRGSIPNLRLRVAGVQLKEDVAFVEELRSQLTEWSDDVEFLPNIDLETKREFLRSISVMSVPATYGESFGLYLVEAMACGVPCVQPRHGAFPEVVEASGAGLLCEPDDPVSLADRLEELLGSPERLGELGERGRAAARDRFTSDRMARDFEELCKLVARASDAA